MGEALLGIAVSLDAENKTDAAIAAYKDLIDHHPNELVVPQAKFGLARLYESQNKAELARDLYQDVERAMPYTAMGNEAGMRIEELVRKYPSLAPPSAAASVSDAINTALKQELAKKNAKPAGVTPAPNAPSQPAGQ